ncbi:glycerophosphodiester phosphodiesterase [Desertivirga xinjiangensis]|uniref:glycerophosphodiester phosphodiesterase n=1 Tax=Desertivirga xinjiangensis TaxID=539206 RepID=UPI00210BA4A6|nr:glycerophosphodiester phosphodiesterase family protein [Pedobacter xinjiangensis]
MFKTLTTNIILLLMVIFKIMGQEHKTIYLSDYTFSESKSKVGFIKINKEGAAIHSASVTGYEGDLFKIGKNNELSIRKTKDPKSWYDVTVVAKTDIGEITNTFRVVNDQFIKNKVIAHRGAWKNTSSPENSVAALKHAISMGCEGSEFDVHLSEDSRIFVNHDATIQNIAIEKTGSEVLSSIKLSNGESLPTLEDFLREGMKQNKTKLILELKPSAVSKERGIALSHKALEIVEQFKAQGWVDYISFDYDICKEIIKLAPYAKVSYLKGEKTPEELAKDKLYGLDYHHSVLRKNPNWIREAHQNKLTVNVWTVNSEDDMDWLLKENVDFITTNEPELLLKKVAKK